MPDSDHATGEENEFEAFGKYIGVQLKSFPTLLALDAQDHIQLYLNEMRRLQLQSASETSRAEGKGSVSAENAFSSNGSIKVAVMAKTYPQTELTPDDLAKLEEAILDEVTLGWSNPLRFKGIYTERGYLLIDCSDAATADWLQMVITSLKSWTGTALCTKTGGDLPIGTCPISIYFPRSAGQRVEKTLALLGNQNDELDTKNWRVMSVRDEGTGQLLIAGISSDILTKIESLEYSLNYRFDRVTVYDRTKGTHQEPPTTTTGENTGSAANVANAAKGEDYVLYSANQFVEIA